MDVGLPTSTFYQFESSEWHAIVKENGSANPQFLRKHNKRATVIL
jgi:hypothetical protein